jgi:hypothetical protein
MNALVLLMGLLVLSYLGGFLADRGAARGLGRPSGIEYVALGLVVGPSALGLAPRALLEPFTPIAHVAIGWLAFGLGLEAAFVDARRTRVSSLLAGWLAALLAAAAVATAVAFVAWRLWSWPLEEALLLAGAISAVSCETARQTVRWVGDRTDARGPLFARLVELAHAGAVVPVAIVGFLFARVSPAAVELPRPEWAGMGITVGLGLVLGVVAAVLLAREDRLDESWGMLLGGLLFAIGIAVRLEIAPLVVTFFLGLSLAALSRHREEIVPMVAPTERPVTIPALLLAGAHIDLGSAGALLLFVVAFAARLVAQLAFGGILWAAARDARPAGPGVGLALLPSGTLSMALALALALRFPGRVGDAALVVAALLALTGELLGPAALRARLARAGEVAVPVQVPEPRPAEAAGATPTAILEEGRS